MSWEAVTWANNQQLKKTYEQCVLLVLANCADPNGEAFVKWPGRDHWWVYLSKKTRLPKSSLFRHLNTLVALGLGERAMQVLADGSRRPTFKLNMNASFNIEVEEDAARYDSLFNRDPEIQSPGETEHDDAAEHDENDSDYSHSQAPEATGRSQSPVGTGIVPSQSPAETNPFPVLRLQEDSLAVPKDSPLPPSGGLSARDDLFEEFVKSWGEPIPKMAHARLAWDRIETVKRGEAVAAAKGYWAWLKAHPKQPTAQSAQSFLRDVAGWPQWLRYVPAGGEPVRISTAYPLQSPEGRAIAVLYDIAGLSDYMRGIKVSNGAVNYLQPVTAQLKKLGEHPLPKDGWVTLTHRQAGAWESLLREALPLITRRRLGEGSRAPWPWPPSGEGKIYTAESAPPQGVLTDDDMADFK